MNRTENTIMWHCLIDIFRDYPVKALEVENFITDYYATDGFEQNNNFSIDNWQVVCCWCHLFVESKKNIPLFGNHTKHPLKFIEMAWMKHWWLKPLTAITLIDMAVRHLTVRRKLGDEYHTSGLLLDYYVFHSYKSWLMVPLTWMMRTMFDSWDAVFERYHGEGSELQKELLEAWRENV